MNIVEELERLQELYRNGTLTEEEVRQAKAAILAKAGEKQPTENTQAVHQQLQELQKQNAILKMDRDWLEERTQHMWQDDFGNAREPKEWMWKFVAIFGTIFGLCMFALGLSIGGVAVCVGGVVALIIIVAFAGCSAWYYSKYDRYKKAYAAYQERRAAALKKSPTDRPIG